MTRADRSRDESPIGLSEHAPLRLADAVRLAYPRGGMTVAGLRREANRGRLEIERVAGKDFTTLADIAKMRALCRDQLKAQGYGSDESAVTQRRESFERDQRGSSETEASSLVPDAFLAKLQRLKHA